MTSNEIIAKGEQFAVELAEKLSDPDETAASKQVYFMDNHERIQKIMGALSQVISSIENALTSSPREIDEEDTENLQKAKKIVTKMKEIITDFQKSLTIDKNIEDSDVVPALTPQSILNATAQNKSAKRLAEDFGTTPSCKDISFNYALCIDGTVNLIYANTKEELNEAINDAIKMGTYNEIDLYRIQATPIPLKKKVILSV